MSIEQCYAFVINVRSLLDASTYQLAEGHDLRRASDDEIARIKGTIDSLTSGTFRNYRLWEYRLELFEPAASPPSSYRMRALQRDDSRVLPREEWRYHVVAFRGDTSILDELTTAFDLSHAEPEVGFTIAHLELGGGSQVGTYWNGARLFHLLEAAEWSLSDFLVDVSTEDISEIVSIHSSLRTYDHHTVDLKRALEQMSDLKRLPHGSPLRFVGYFSIIESLLTHQPKATDTIDSITRQVRTKLALLNQRFEHAIDYNDFAATLDKVWTTMYRYRSVVAHGGAPDFKKDLAVLKNPTRALSLLKETTKALIKHTLREPELIRDLRGC